MYTYIKFHLMRLRIEGLVAIRQMRIYRESKVAFFGWGAFKCCKMYNKTWGSEARNSVRESVYPGRPFCLHNTAGETLS